ncbi:hypothetical protein Cfla_1133 [Cellulomonas flavigena DSM 20109]|uniref:Lipoprotein n=1 Tax=Cellulomonas flavigena (strain ATCC 482 / DSM 20109 / BCRC 11376 / JCM 18109 / NBRC 3775 / NCIMB 8073 / NRS 134) TaxID=446466 RepID=D5ULJ5_CELFN|nr:hypothetical protein [Cellulomonas flavigena]ADG74037.1 hypothetical protein Cfla_1133 [Cellulomonas flavigena DSM 20109]
MSHSPAARRPSSLLVAPLVAVALLSACTAGDTPDPVASAAAPTATASSGASPTAEPTAGPPAGEAGTELPLGDGGPEASFQTWLAASRAPVADVACSYMTPELADRMVAEIAAQGLPVTDCPALIDLTAGLYAASGQSAETAVEVVEQTDDMAVLHVVYTEGSSCGRVVMVPSDGHWVLDERSKEEC